MHLHLEGSIEPETACELDPTVSLEEAAARYRFEGFGGFIDAFKWAAGLLRTPDDYALAARRLLERLAEDNVRYAEITLSAGVVLWKKQDFAAIYHAVTREAARSAVQTWWVLDAIRHFGPEHAMDVARLAADRAGDRVVAFGIGGDESRGPVDWFGEAFTLARGAGLKLVPHAGETCGAESVWAAVRAGADRIGHGIRAIEDPALVRLLVERRIPLEVCLSSNLATGVTRSLGEHPAKRLHDAGVAVVLNTDDPAMFGTGLSREFELARRLGFSEGELRGVADNAFRHAFRFSR